MAHMGVPPQETTIMDKTPLLEQQEERSRAYVAGGSATTKFKEHAGGFV
jgi:hypothetical protein